MVFLVVYVVLGVKRAKAMMTHLTHTLNKGNNVSPFHIHITHEKVDEVLEKSQNNSHTMTIRRCVGLMTDFHSRATALTALSNFVQTTNASDVMSGPRY